MGRSLALQTKTSLRLDLSYLAKGTKRQYGLGAFAIKAEFAPPLYDVLLKLADLPFGRRIGVFGMQFASRGAIQYVMDSESGFDNSVHSLTGSLIVRGYWQSEKYFLNNATVIRSDFQFRAPPTVENAKYLERIGGVPVSRVDVGEEDVLLGGEADGEPGPTEIVRINHGRADFEDMRLMSACKHFIIANSSFSWWAAWLGVHPGKVVIAPKRWFSIHHADTRDLLPDTWIKV